MPVSDPPQSALLVFGDGAYPGMEAMIEKLLAEEGRLPLALWAKTSTDSRPSAIA
jgi:hypothetical protein